MSDMPRDDASWRMRIALAMDVIQQIAAGKLAAVQGVYCDIKRDGESIEQCDGVMQQQLDVLVREGSVTCDVCALGSLVVAYALERDATTVGDTRSSTPIRERLVPFFGTDQLDLIEDVFEGDVSVGRGHDCDDDCDDDCEGGEIESFYAERSSASESTLEAAYAFQGQYEDPDDRLAAIMRNIVRNGSFMPEKGE